MSLIEDFLKDGLRISITDLISWFKQNPSALDLVSYDFSQVVPAETCDVRECESEAEFFVFDPSTNDEIAHVCLNCFDQATNGASGGTTAYFARVEALMGEREAPAVLEWDELCD
jgi:hypothetical protein